MPSAHHGCATASETTVITPMSSVVLTIPLLNGSGEVLTASLYAGLHAVRRQRGAAAQRGEQRLVDTGRVAGELPCDPGSDGRANDGGDAIPDRVEPRDLVDDELDEEHHAGDDEHVGATERARARSTCR